MFPPLMVASFLLEEGQKEASYLEVFRRGQRLLLCFWMQTGDTVQSLSSLGKVKRKDLLILCHLPAPRHTQYTMPHVGACPHLSALIFNRPWLCNNKLTGEFTGTKLQVIVLQRLFKGRFPASWSL